MVSKLHMKQKGFKAPMKCKFKTSDEVKRFQNPDEVWFQNPDEVWFQNPDEVWFQT
jgi:hypothetical protein